MRDLEVKYFTSCKVFRCGGDFWMGFAAAAVVVGKPFAAASLAVVEFREQLESEIGKYEINFTEMPSGSLMKF